MSVLAYVYERHMADRRIQALSRQLADVIPVNRSLLDVGCGNGRLASLLLERRPDLQLRGVDVIPAATSHLPVAIFDGERLPYPDAAFDSVMLIDTLHHSRDPLMLLKEASRVARHGLIIKDHTRDGLLADTTLRLMDWCGNAHRGVGLPYTYWPKRQWLETFDQLGLRLEVWKEKLGLYPWPVSWVCDRSLHFVARLALPNGAQG